MKDDLIGTFKISRLVAADLTGSLDDSGRRELDAWLREADENRVIYREIKEKFTKGKREWLYSEKQVEQQLAIFHKYRTKKTARVLGVWWRYVAVAVLLFSVAGILRWQMDGEGRKQSLVPIEIAQGNAMLVLSTGERIALVDTLQTVCGESSADIQVSGQTISYREENKPVQEQVYNTLVVPRDISRSLPIRRSLLL